MEEEEAARVAKQVQQAKMLAAQKRLADNRVRSGGGLELFCIASVLPVLPEVFSTVQLMIHRLSLTANGRHFPPIKTARLGPGPWATCPFD